MRILNPLPILRREYTLVSAFLTLLLAFLYVTSALFLLNYRFIFETVTGFYPLQYKLQILGSIIAGAPKIFLPLDFFLLLVSAVLIGINITLLIKSILELKRRSLKLSFGGVLLPIMGVGCPGCGITLLSLLGPSASFVFLPFQTTLLQIAGIILLVFSFFSLLKNFTPSKCIILSGNKPEKMTKVYV